MKIEDLKNLKEDLIKEQMRFTIPLKERGKEALILGVSGIAILVMGIAFTVLMLSAPLSLSNIHAVAGCIVVIMLGILGIAAAIESLKQPPRYYLLQKQIKKINRPIQEDDQFIKDYERSQKVSRIMSNIGEGMDRIDRFLGTIKQRVDSMLENSSVRFLLGL